MNLEFYKYHGAGNDFIMIDCRNADEKQFSLEVVKHLCDRHLGIGSDGLILLLEDNSADFRMKYFNSDGKEGTMCGNGGRCITAFARDLGIIKDKTVFSGIDGLHHASFQGGEIVDLQMIDVKGVNKFEDGFLINTGSPHFVCFKKSIQHINVFGEGREMRHQERFSASGANINFVETLDNNSFKIRTYERGVEDETLACGTGSVASAISSYILNKTDKSSYIVEAKGGRLEVRFNANQDGTFTDVWLKGPVKFVFKGEISL